AAAAVFIYRKRDARLPNPLFMVPLHPWSTLLLIAVVIGVAIAVVTATPMDSLYGAIVLVTGVLFFFVWKAAHKASRRKAAAGEVIG
ncbi:MAG: hypothetical protein JO030_06405, partial [Candidatus Eremiobacteraeota bacterium]|nr:hypothetical protein [Candidatus Eremiobacteraeota bacterium]